MRKIREAFVRELEFEQTLEAKLELEEKGGEAPRTSAQAV